MLELDLSYRPVFISSIVYYLFGIYLLCRPNWLGWLIFSLTVGLCSTYLTPPSSTFSSYTGYFYCCSILRSFILSFIIIFLFTYVNSFSFWRILSSNYYSYDLTFSGWSTKSSFFSSSKLCWILCSSSSYSNWSNITFVS